MSTKALSILYDLLCILFFVFYAGWIFSIFNLMVFFLGKPLVLLPIAFLRPCEYKVGKTRYVIIVLIFFVVFISVVVAYFLGVKKLIDDSGFVLLPAWFQLILGGCFLVGAFVMLSKLLQDLKISKKME